MGQQQKHEETHHTERNAVLSGLDAKIDDLDITIASLMAEQHTLKRAREYVLSTHKTASDISDDTNAPANRASKLSKGPTYPRPSLTTKKARSSLRQEVLIRNAMEREKSSSPPGSVGLLSSDEFEASFPDHNVHGGNKDSKYIGGGADNGVGDDVRPSVERMSSLTPENHSAHLSITTTNAFSRSSTPSPDSETIALDPPARHGQGAHWQAKRVTKRKRQENAAKARAARRKRMGKAKPTAV